MAETSLVQKAKVMRHHVSPLWESNPGPQDDDESREPTNYPLQSGRRVSGNVLDVEGGEETDLALFQLS